MNDIPLLKRRIDADINDCFQDKDGNVLLFSDVVSALRKFRKGYFGKSVEYFINSTNECCKCKECAYILSYINNKFYCKSCWFKECFGKLPEEKELSKK